jgi:autotransporter-associated beta strand protein
MPRRNHARLVLAAAASVAGFATLTQPAGAQTLYWDGDADPSDNVNDAAGTGLGGAGTWNATNLNWWDGTSGTDTTWVNGADIVVKSPAVVASNIITINGVFNANTITMGPTHAHTFSPGVGSSLSFNSLTVSPTGGVAVTFSGNIDGTDFNIIGNSSAITNNVLIGGNNNFTGNVNLGGTILSGTPSIAARLALLINTVDAVPDTATFNFGRNYSQVNFNVAGNHGNVPNNFVLNSNNNVTGYEGWIGIFANAQANLTGVISGDGSLGFGLGGQGGQGVLTLSNNNTYTGNTRWMSGAAGVTQLGVDNALPTTTGLIWGNGATAVNLGAFDLNGFDQTITSITTATATAARQNGIVNGSGNLSDQSILTFKGNVTATYDGPLGSLGHTTTSVPNSPNHANIKVVLHADNTGIQTFASGMAYSGGTEINGGMLSVTNTTGSGTGTGPITIGSGGTLRIGATSASGAVSTANPVTNNGILIVNRTDAVAQSAIVGVINGTGTLTKNGNGTLTLDTANGYSGATIVNAGTLTVTDASGLGGTTGALAVNNPTIGAGTNVVLNLPTTAATTKGSLSGTIFPTPASGTNTATINNGGQLLTINQTADATFDGVIAGTGGFALGSSSTAKLTLSGVNTYTGGTTVSAGTLVLGNADATAGGAISIADGALAQAQASLPKAVTVSTLNTNTSGKFDLTDNSMVVKDMAVAAVQAEIVKAFNAGQWNSTTGGLTSSTAATASPAVTAIGFASNGILNKSEFKGVTGLDADDVLVKYTYYGDSDLNGQTTLDDYTLFLNGYQTAGNTWVQGDYDYNGLVTLDDFTLFLAGYQQQGAPLTALEAMINSTPMTSADRSAMLAAVQAVPEPAGLGLVGILGAGLLRRRRGPARV